MHVPALRRFSKVSGKGKQIAHSPTVSSGASDVELLPATLNRQDSCLSSEPGLEVSFARCVVSTRACSAGWASHTTKSSETDRPLFPSQTAPRVTQSAIVIGCSPFSSPGLRLPSVDIQLPVFVSSCCASGTQGAAVGFAVVASAAANNAVAALSRPPPPPAVVASSQKLQCHWGSLLFNIGAPAAAVSVRSMTAGV